jgi:hypothetical protein
MEQRFCDVTMMRFVDGRRSAVVKCRFDVERELFFACLENPRKRVSHATLPGLRAAVGAHLTVRTGAYWRVVAPTARRDVVEILPGVDGVES